MRLSDAFIKYMNGSISKKEYLNFYPVEKREFVKIPKRKKINLQEFNSLYCSSIPVFTQSKEIELFDCFNRLKPVIVAQKNITYKKDKMKYFDDDGNEYEFDFLPELEED